jgi:hypothetical protein
MALRLWVRSAWSRRRSATLASSAARPSATRKRSRLWVLCLSWPLPSPRENDDVCRLPLVPAAACSGHCADEPDELLLLGCCRRRLPLASASSCWERGRSC